MMNMEHHISQKLGLIMKTDRNKTQIDNPAAALVTQVPQGATKPVVNPT